MTPTPFLINSLTSYWRLVTYLHNTSWIVSASDHLGLSSARRRKDGSVCNLIRVTPLFSTRRRFDSCPAHLAQDKTTLGCRSGHPTPYAYNMNPANRSMKGHADSWARCIIRRNGDTYQKHSAALMVYRRGKKRGCAFYRTRPPSVIVRTVARYDNEPVLRK